MIGESMSSGKDMGKLSGAASPGLIEKTTVKKKPLAPMPGMADRVKLLKEIMKKRGPVAKGQPVRRGAADFTRERGYKFGPPERKMM